jgi:hypothetical protein
MRHFHRCKQLSPVLCDADYNETGPLRVERAAAGNLSSKARADAWPEHRRKSPDSHLWDDKWKQDDRLPTCGKPARHRQVLQPCGASLALDKCPTAAIENARRQVLQQLRLPEDEAWPQVLQRCGAQLSPGTKFCGECGAKAE